MNATPLQRFLLKSFECMEWIRSEWKTGDSKRPEVICYEYGNDEQGQFGDFIEWVNKELIEEYNINGFRILSFQVIRHDVTPCDIKRISDEIIAVRHISVVVNIELL